MAVMRVMIDIQHALLNECILVFHSIENDENVAADLRTLSPNFDEST